MNISDILSSINEELGQQGIESVEYLLNSDIEIEYFPTNLHPEEYSNNILLAVKDD